MYWTIESWGSGYLPINADEVICMANEMIDAYVAEHPDYGEMEFREYSARLWEDFCATGCIGDVVAVYGGD